MQNAIRFPNNCVMLIKHKRLKYHFTCLCGHLVIYLVYKNNRTWFQNKRIESTTREHKIPEQMVETSETIATLQK